MTQKALLLERLREGPVCSFDFYRPNSPLTHRIGARVWDLKRDGWTISTRPCRHEWHQSAAVEYVLEQGVLFV